MNDELAEALDAIAWRTQQVASDTASGYDVTARDGEAMLAALRELLGVHRPDHHRQPLCAGCMDVWPCQDYSIIRRHLLNGGEEL